MDINDLDKCHNEMNKLVQVLDGEEIKEMDLCVVDSRLYLILLTTKEQKETFLSIYEC